MLTDKKLTSCNLKKAEKLSNLKLENKRNNEHKNIRNSLSNHDRYNQQWKVHSLKYCT